MHRTPDATGCSPLWVHLEEASKRLSYLGNYTRFVLEALLTRGRVPVLAMRNDVVGPLPDRIEALLTKARSISVVAHNNVVIGHFLFASEQDTHQVLGPRSHFTLAEPEPRRFPIIINLDFDQVRVCWTTVIRELRQVDWFPADETAAILRKLGLWLDSWGPIGSGAADAGVAAHDAAEAPDAASIDDLLARWIFDRHSREMSFDALYAEARRAPPKDFRKADFLTAYRKVYATERHRPPATGWPLRSPYKERLAKE